MNYRFEQFNVEIINPTIEVVGVNDFINDKTCSVDVVLHTDTSRFGVKLTGFIYERSWDDIDIINWVNTEIDKFSV